jgi:hypothetical protein
MRSRRIAMPASEEASSAPRIVGWRGKKLDAPVIDNYSVDEAIDRNSGHGKTIAGFRESWLRSPT